MPRSEGRVQEVKTLEELAIKMLDCACPSNTGVDGTDFNLYWLETHCVGFWVTARKVDGVWKISTVVAEDC